MDFSQCIDTWQTRLSMQFIAYKLHGPRVTFTESMYVSLLTIAGLTSVTLPYTGYPTPGALGTTKLDGNIELQIESDHVLSFTHNMMRL
jgi:hypothetical protein